MNAARTIVRHELLNSREHARLRIRPPQPIGRHFVPIVTSEFPDAAASCPILFSKQAINRRLYTGAMFGFKPGENVVNADPCGETFMPLTVECDGFFILRDQIYIDRGNSRFSETDGEPLFDDACKPSSRLRKVQRALGRLRAGKQATRQFTRTLQDLRLIEPIEFSLPFEGSERRRLHGLYRVSIDSLLEVDHAVALRLCQSGHLQLAHTMSASLSKIGIHRPSR